MEIVFFLDLASAVGFSVVYTIHGKAAYFRGMFRDLAYPKKENNSPINYEYMEKAVKLFSLLVLKAQY